MPESQAAKPADVRDELSDHQARLRGNQAFKDGRYDDAIAAYTEGLLADKNNYELLSNRSGAYSQKGEYESALADAKKCTEIKPDFAKGFSRLGYALLKLDRYTDAINAYDKGLVLDPHWKPMMDGRKDAVRRRDQWNEHAKRPARASHKPPYLVWLAVPFRLLLGAVAALALLGVAGVSGGGGRSGFALVLSNLALSMLPDLLARNWHSLLQRYPLHYIGLAILCYMTNYFFLALPLVVLVATEESCADVGAELARQGGSVGRLGRMLASFAAQPFWPKAIGQAELGTGLVTILNLFVSGQPDVILPIIYWQWLRIRVMLGAPTGDAFRNLDGMLSPALRRVPGVGRLYTVLAKLLASHAKMPEPGRKPGVCRIM